MFHSFIGLLCRCAALALFCLLLANPRPSLADGPQTNVISRLFQAFADARLQFQNQKTNTDAAWQFARACFDLADIASNNTQRADFANQGIAAARLAVSLNSNSAPGHYYLGMDIGQLAETKHNPSAFKMVKEMEREFLTADALDEHFDFAGPDRNLGLLYRDAPIIISVGSRSKSRQHLLEAADLAPDFPENLLNLIESDLKWGNHAEAQQKLEDLKKVWPDAQKKFIGDKWILSWVDWSGRFDDAQKKLKEPQKPSESPHTSR
jgi:tetratricopeptide (TPR) repeat protein